MAEKIIDQAISSQKISMLSASTDWYCPHLKDEIAKAGCSEYLTVLEVDCQVDCTKAELLNYCARLTGGRALPKFWVKGRYFGGGAEMETALKNGSMIGMLGRL